VSSVATPVQNPQAALGWVDGLPYLHRKSNSCSDEFYVSIWHRVSRYWPNAILGMSVKVFLLEINIWICRLSKADCPLSRGFASSNQLKLWIEQKYWAGMNFACLPACLPAWLPACAGASIFSCPWNETYNISSPDSQAFRLRLEIDFWLSWIPSCEFWNVYNHENKFLIYIYKNPSRIYLCIYLP